MNQPMAAPRSANRGRSWLGAGLTSLRGLALLVVILGIWQLVGNPNSPYYPPPSSWVSAIRDVAGSTNLSWAVGQTVLLFLAALIITVIIGSLLGMALGVSATAEDALNPLFQFLRAIPAAAIVPALTLLLGATTGMSITVIVLAAVWPVLLSVRSGMQNLNPLLRDVSATLQLPRRSWLRKVILPSMLPSILLGTRVCAPIALLITLLVQLLTGTAGIGGLLSQAQSEFNSSAVYGYVAISGILSILVNLALRGIERLVVIAETR